MKKILRFPIERTRPKSAEPADLGPMACHMPAVPFGPMTSGMLGLGFLAVPLPEPTFTFTQGQLDELCQAVRTAAFEEMLREALTNQATVELALANPTVH